MSGAVSWPPTRWRIHSAGGDAGDVGYDARTRSEIATSQNKAALRSMFELAGINAGQPVTLYFGPTTPAGQAAGRWIQTIPGTGWFVYFRIYGPDAPAFDGTWQLPDFERS